MFKCVFSVFFFPADFIVVIHMHMFMLCLSSSYVFFFFLFLNKSEYQVTLVRLHWTDAYIGELRNKRRKSLEHKVLKLVLHKSSNKNR